MSAPAGLFLVDKPAGLSSAQVVGTLKKRIKPDKIGHAGTLDPMATGLLVCLIGRATRLADYALDGGKRYQGVMRFGLTTDSDDITGATLSESVPDFSDQQLADAVERLKGEIEQFPPRISAVKVSGERAYKLARAGEEVHLEARRVQVHQFLFERVGKNQLRYDIACSKGTYIRSIARDLGEMLGCGGTLESIRRTESSPFCIADATPLELITPENLKPWEIVFAGAPRVALSQYELVELQGGVQSCIVRALGARFDEHKIVLYGDSERAYGFFERIDGKWLLGLHLG